jgi:cytochrome P450
MTELAPPIDLLSSRSFAYGQPHEQFRWLRENDPVHWHAEPGGAGFWAVTRYDDVRFVGREPRTFSSRPTIMIPDATSMEVPDHPMMIAADPPEHTRLRRVVARDFVPRAAKLLRPRIEELARTIVDQVAARGSCDLVTDVAGLMPSYVIADLLGIPHADGVELYALTEAVHAIPGESDGPTGADAVARMFAYAHDVWESKRDHPTGDIASTIVHGSAGDRPLDELDFQLFFMLLIDAGGDTTRNLVAGGVRALFDHPGEHARLRADVDGLLPTAVEELLRWVSPVVYMRRTALHDTELAGRPIAAGDKVVVYYGSANRDPAAFDDPERFDVARDPNEHIAFGGGGPHFCLGAHVGRIEIHALLRELLTRLPDITPDGPTTWLPSNFISGPKAMPVRFTPA